jgi:mono/diheme cytochrome c family protein
MSAVEPEDKNPKIEQAGASDESIQQVHSILLREKPEPKESDSPMPLFLLGFISAMVLMVAIYFVHNSGGFSPMVYDERFDPKNAPASTAEAKVDSAVLGKKAFVSVCATCHQATGMGVPGVYPPLVKSEWANGSEERVIRILLHGLQGPIKVEGKDYNSVMPAIGPGGYNFSDEKIAAVLTYVRQEWGNNAPPVTKEKVTEIRTKAAAGRTAAWTSAELEALP